MKSNLKALERKHDILKEEFESHLRWVREMVADDISVQSVAFEQNLINHALQMCEAKSRLREIDMQIEFLKLM